MTPKEFLTICHNAAGLRDPLYLGVHNATAAVGPYELRIVRQAPIHHVVVKIDGKLYGIAMQTGFMRVNVRWLDDKPIDEQSAMKLRLVGDPTPLSFDEKIYNL